LVAVIMALVEAVKWLLAKRSNGKLKPPCVLSRDEHAWLEDLWKQHQRCDVDGTPLWYVPRSLVNNQREMQRAISDNTSKVNALTDSVQRLERIVDRRRNND
jgi:hypothetical protein